MVLCRTEIHFLQKDVFAIASFITFHIKLCFKIQIIKREIMYFHYVSSLYFISHILDVKILILIGLVNLIFVFVWE